MSNPYVKFGVVALVLFVVLAVPSLWLFGGSLFGVALAYLVAINVATYLIYRYDKQIAGKGRTRVKIFSDEILGYCCGTGDSYCGVAGFLTQR